MNVRTRLACITVILILTSVSIVLLLWPKTTREIIYYYSMAQLTNTTMSKWNPQLPIPLSPDKAVASAINYANSNRPKPLNWDVDSIELNQYSQFWFYAITLTDRQSGTYELDIIRILLDGDVWKPDKRP